MNLTTKYLRYFIQVCAFLIIYAFSFATPAVTPSAPAIPKSLVHNISAIVMNNQTQDIVYQYDSSTPRLVASNMKLITAAAALQELHPDFHWHTKLYYTGSIDNGTLNGNLYIVGGGDPTFDERALREILGKLKDMQIHTIKGDLIIDNTIFNSLPTYSMLKVENYDIDTTLPNGFMVDSDISQFIIHINKKHKITINSNLYQYSIINKLSLNRSLKACPDLSKMVSFKNKNIVFAGKISPTCNNIKLEFNLLPHEDYVLMALSQALNDLSLSFSGRLKYAKFTDKDNSAKLVYDYSSQSLEDALIYMNHYSVNLIAETSLLSLGAYTTSNNDTYKQAKQVYTDYMQKNNLLNNKFKAENGAGLSRTEYMSADNMAHLLWLMAHSANSVNFENTLPRAGEEGTLKHNFTNFGDKVRFKTGTLNDTRAYSGYFYAKDGTKYIVVVITNNVNANDSNFNHMLDNWVSKLLYFTSQL
ncbi:MAG: hypothetical protein QG673_1465 [Pseudomonadota bacterium]|nr:hypothetical protein [Pseudomonadota bacterium]